MMSTLKRHRSITRGHLGRYEDAAHGRRREPRTAESEAGAADPVAGAVKAHARAREPVAAAKARAKERAWRHQIGPRSDHRRNHGRASAQVGEVAAVIAEAHRMAR